VTASNQVRIGNTTVTSIGGYADWTNISDGRFKDDVREDVPGIDFIMSLRPVTYHLDVESLQDYLGCNTGDVPQQTERQSGFIAQEVEAAAAQLGFTFSGVDAPEQAGDTYGLRYAQFVVPLVEAMQEQQLLLMTLQQQVAAQQKMIDQLLMLTTETK
jgi:hypothetical protein